MRLATVETPQGRRLHVRGPDGVKGALLGRRYWGTQEREAIEQAREMLDRFGLLDLADKASGRQVPAPPTYTTR